MSKAVYLDAPSVGRLEKEYLNRAIDSGYISTIGPFVMEFEEKFAEFLRVKRAVSTQSGTAALHVALTELGIGKGDEVIVPALTFIATVNPVMYVGAKPVFADVDARTWNIDPEEVEALISKRTKAIIPVHLYGNPCAMDRIMKIAKAHKVYVIEDATESLGATFNSNYTGAFGDFGCFSFNGNKIVTTGGGGIIVGKDQRKLAHIKFLVNQARDETKEYFYPEIGFNYRMTNIEAALGLAQIKKLDEFLTKKRLFNSIYREELKGICGISFQESYASANSSCWFTCITLSRANGAAAAQKELKAHNIPSRRIFIPVTEFPPYKKFRKYDCPISADIYERGLCLPCSTLNNYDAVYYTCKVLKEFLKRR